MAAEPAEPTRRLVLRGIVELGRPACVAELAERFGLHHTAIRHHLAKLVDAGLVIARPTPPAGRGRPPLRYEATPDGVASLRPVAHYQELAAILAEAVRTGRGARAMGRHAGARVGARHAGPPALEVVTAEAARWGFEPRVHVRPGGGADVALGHCPFADVAAREPVTVCQLHLGWAEGLAATAGDRDVLGLEVRDPHRAGCRIRLGALRGPS